MYKGTAENIKVKQKIMEAYFHLLRIKQATISITDIVETAGVSRPSYYRNFRSKEDVLNYFINTIRKEFHSHIKSLHGEKFTNNLFDYNPEELRMASEELFKFFLIKKSYFLTLYDRGYENLLHQFHNDYILETFGAYISENELYKFYFISGGILNTVMNWLQSGAKESPYEMSIILADLVYAKSL